MSKETYYFPHDYNARTDRKLINVAMRHGMTGIGVYWCIVEMLYEEGGYLPNEYERISFELRTDKNVIQSIINDFDLFQNDTINFWAETALDRLKQRCDKSVKARLSINKRWEKYERNTNVIRPKSKRNTRKGKERKEKNVYNVFYDNEILLSKSDPEYLKIVKVFFGENNLGIPLSSVLKMEAQLSYEQFQRIMKYKKKYTFSTIQILESMENWGNPKHYTTVYGTFQTFLKRELNIKSL